MQAKEESRRLQRMRLLLRQMAAYSIFIILVLLYCYGSYNSSVYDLNKASLLNIGWHRGINIEAYKPT